MTNKIERIDRLSYLIMYGYSKYTQEIERSRFVTEEKAEVEYYQAIEAFGEKGTKINYLV